MQSIKKVTRTWAHAWCNERHGSFSRQYTMEYNKRDLKCQSWSIKVKLKMVEL